MKEHSCVCKQNQLKKNRNLFAHRSYRGEHNKSTSRKKKVVTRNVIKSFVCRLEIVPKYFDNIKPETGPIRKARPDL